MRQRYAAMVALILLSACSRPPPQYAINIDRLNEVVTLIKSEVGAYLSDYNARELRRRASLVTASTDSACNNGMLDFRLTAVEMHLTTTQVRSTSASADISIPIVPGGVPLGSAGFGAAGSRSTTNSQELQFGSVILPNSEYHLDISAGDRERYNLLRMLNALRDALLAAARQPPCFDAARADDPFENTFTIAFTAEEGAGGGVTLTLGLATLGAKTQQTVTSSNTITVTFAPREDPAPAPAPKRPGARPDRTEPPPSTEPVPRERSGSTWRYRNPRPGTGWFF